MSDRVDGKPSCRVSSCVEEDAAIPESGTRMDNNHEPRRVHRMTIFLEMLLIGYVLHTSLLVLVVVVNNARVKLSGEGVMVTDVIRELSSREPILPAVFCLALGILIGHLWR